MLLAKKDEARVILSNEQNDFLLANVVQMEELEELSANICMMARIQPANNESDEGPSYDSAFISDVQTPSTSYMNPLFSNSNHEQTYHEQPKIIKAKIIDDQINSDIIFDDPNVEVNSGSVEHDKNAHDSHDIKLEQLARNAYKEVEDQQCSNLYNSG
uniref:Retrovirus-related Pol polyprotein from transposon TNT 1-94 n=1 Tax=Tanacetum cinerariifolium TaxID=118510 RepID=A0A6L2N425_TANCI|nr:retrovirus-related Pol polyprotein from transposon TNT 1-94 [Tanacetum cinerariifolium]